MAVELPFCLAYFITYSCYGTKLHGDPVGTVDRENNLYKTPFVKPDLRRERNERQRMIQPPFELDRIRRERILASVKEVCTHRNWPLLAAHVRSNHVHVVVHAEVKPERTASDYAEIVGNLLRFGSQ
jgi:hypothetical protein